MLINIVSQALDAKLKPLEDNLESIKADMAKLKKGVQVTCRNDLEELYATEPLQPDIEMALLSVQFVI